MKNFILLILLLGTLNCCEKEKECNPNCGPSQICKDGICGCRSDEFLLGNSCINKCDNCYIGAFECGCTNKYILDISQFDNNLVLLKYTTPNTLGFSNSMTDVVKIGSNVYRFLIPRSCDVDGRTSTHIEFVVDKSDIAKIMVEARYLILPSNETLASCSTFFTK